jgi:hypothetical protein
MTPGGASLRGRPVLFVRCPPDSEDNRSGGTMTTITLRPMTEAHYAATCRRRGRVRRSTSRRKLERREVFRPGPRPYDHYCTRACRRPITRCSCSRRRGSRSRSAGRGFTRDRRGQRQAFIFVIRVYPAFQRGRWDGPGRPVPPLDRARPDRLHSSPQRPRPRLYRRAATRSPIWEACPGVESFSVLSS